MRPVAGHQRQPGGNGIGRVAKGPGCAIDGQRPAVRLAESGEHIEQLILPLPFQGHDA